MDLSYAYIFVNQEDRKTLLSARFCGCSYPQQDGNKDLNITIEMVCLITNGTIQSQNNQDKC